MDKVFVVTILDYYTGFDRRPLPDRQILGVGTSMGIAVQMAEERLEKLGVPDPVWRTSSTKHWTRTDTVFELFGAEIRAYDVIK